MKDDKPDRIPLAAPVKGHPDDRARVPLEVALGLIPGVSGLLKLWAEFFPTQAQRARGKWEGDVTERTNDHAERLADHDQAISPTTDLTGPAVALAVALARAPGDGMGGRFRELPDLCKLTPDLDQSEVETAVFELEQLGLVEITHAMNNWWLRLTQKFYEQVDHQVMGWHSTTLDDARTLAKLLLDDESRKRTSVLHAASEWERRRFNPAFRVLLQFISMYSKEIQADYPSSSVILMPEDRARLRQLISDRV